LEGSPKERLLKEGPVAMLVAALRGVLSNAPTNVLARSVLRLDVKLCGKIGAGPSTDKAGPLDAEDFGKTAAGGCKPRSSRSDPASVAAPAVLADASSNTAGVIATGLRRTGSKARPVLGGASSWAAVTGGIAVSEEGLGSADPVRGKRGEESAVG
jgi:hypothetical protein